MRKVCISHVATVLTIVALSGAAAAQAPASFSAKYKEVAKAANLKLEQ